MEQSHYDRLSKRNDFGTGFRPPEGLILTLFREQAPKFCWVLAVQLIFQGQIEKGKAFQLLQLISEIFIDKIKQKGQL